MRVLDRYIVKSLLGGIALVLAVLAVLLAVYLFIDEQAMVGMGRYGQWQALRYALMSLPVQLLVFLPVAALIGGLMVLGSMANHGELAVIRAAGVSRLRIAGSVMLAGALLVPVAALTGEFLAPQLMQMARLQKSVERGSGISFTGSAAAWLHDGELLLHAANARTTEAGLGGITVYRVAGTQLIAVEQGRSARELPGGRWELRDYRASRFGPDQVLREQAPAQMLATRANPDFFELAVSDPMELSLRELTTAIRQLAAGGHDVRHHRFAFWSSIARLVALPLALLLALPLVLNSRRPSERGARLTAGLFLGLAYFILQRMVESGTLAFSLYPPLLAWLPVMLLAAGVAMLLRGNALQPRASTSAA
jgi:lipopolysaccharide export system permease protein